MEEKLYYYLCHSIPFGLKVNYNNDAYTLVGVNGYHEVLLEDSNGICQNYTVGIEDIKPYLRFFSSMTEEERVEYEILEKQCERLPTFAYISVSKCDWLNAHHFDYRGLISIDLALVAPKGMYENI